MSNIGPYVPTLLDEENPGPYNRLYEMLFEGAPFDAPLKIMPINRAHKVFFSGGADCLFLGADNREYYKSEGIPDMLISNIMNRLYLKAYTRKGEPTIENRADLEGKMLAGEVGVLQNFVDYTPKPKGAELVPVATNEQAFSILLKKRVDIVIAFTLDAEFYFSEHGGEQYSSSENYYVYENTEAIACHPTEAGRSVINYVNPIINKMVSEGTIQRLFENPN